MGQALLQVVSVLAHAVLAASVVADERQEVFDAWQLVKQLDLEGS